jgi:3-oxoacyl-(acyl-carrier-protein) synthase
MITSLPNPERRAVVTGVGAIAPTGVGTGPYWSATKLGQSGIRAISRFDASPYSTQFAGEVVDFEATDYVDRRLAVQTDRWTWMALAAAQMAFEDAAFDPAEHDPFAMSVITASSSGGVEFGQVEIQKLWAQGPRFVGAYQSIAWFYAATTGQISIRYGMKGHSGVVATEGAGGLEALAQSRRAIRRGMDAIVSGGLEAPLCPYALCCQTGNGRMSTVAADTAYRPFDERASGYLPGEGGAILLVETLEAARRRDATVYGEIAGYGATNDARLPTDGPADGAHLARAIRIALDDARMTADEVDLVLADGAGSVDADAAEAQALYAALGDRARTVPVTVPKTMIGRTYAGGASLDAAAALLSMRDGVIPPTINLERTAPGCELRFVRDAAETADVRNVLVVARGYGGFNSALVLKRDV